MNEERRYFDVRTKVLKIGRHLQAVLREPCGHTSKRHTGIVLMHSDENYLSFPAGPELAKRGYVVLAANVPVKEAPLDEKVLAVKAAVEFLLKYDKVERVLLCGHSGGATLMTAYQTLAENGADGKLYDGKIAKFTSDLNGLPVPDGIMLLDANYGNAVMTLFSMDPAVTEESGIIGYDERLDSLRPEVGYDPSGATYDDAFVKAFLKAQGERMNRVTDLALERLHLIERGKGNFLDDEPFIVPGARLYGPNNKIFPQDLRFLSHTKRPHTLLRKNGIVTDSIVPCLRKPRIGFNTTAQLDFCLVTTVRTFLTSYAIRTTSDYGYDADSVFGVEWISSFGNGPGNAYGISAPMLAMGMTGGYEYLAAEIIYDNAKSTDKTLAFVEGAGHNFEPETAPGEAPDKYGDTMKITFDYADDWVSARF